MTDSTPKPAKKMQGVKLRGADKVARIPVKVIPTVDVMRKPSWIKVRLGNNAEVGRIARDVPVLQAGVEPLVQLRSDGILQGAALDPFAQHRFEVAQCKEKMF